ncbi:MAG: antibiotic biosynthesis monooxygenase [Candidatus Obscuribacterales bacterium]|nr:antibiotic biosynthesis monooxygenase [Candidatus Obscuribacterales bacterium]
MFCVIYQWRIKEGKEEQFRELWRTVTKSVYEKHGSFGSRLHKSDDGSLIAYAQWPNQESWTTGTKALSDSLVGTNWQELIVDEGKTLHKLSLLDDLLKQEQFSAT